MYRDDCVFRQSKTRGKEDPIRVSFYDLDGQRVNDVTRKEANCIAAKDPTMLFYFEDGNGYQRELLIPEVNVLTIEDQLPDAPTCPTNPKFCGPPRVQVFGGMGMGVMANAVVSPNSRSIIGFDIVNPGFNFIDSPVATLVDECGKGAGSKLQVQLQPYSGEDTRGTKGGLEVKNIVVKSKGDGYLPAPDGSMGGNGRIWKDVNEGYVETQEGTFYVVPPTPTGIATTPTAVVEPPNLPPGDIFFPPQPNPTVADPETGEPPSIVVPSYPVITEIEEVFVDDPGFNYVPGDTIEVIDPETNEIHTGGSILEPVINERGEIDSVNIIAPGIGFVDLPEIRIISNTGYNARLLPVLKVRRIADIPPEELESFPADAEVISVVDCVGVIPPKTQFDIVPR